MKIKFKNKATSALLASVLFMGMPSGFANTDISDTAATSGLAGSLLASRVAIDDNDDDVAVQFLERALAFDKDNVKIKQDLFAAYVTNGRLEDAATLAKSVAKLGSANNLRGFVLAAHEMRKRSFNKVPDALKDVAGVDLDKTMREVTIAWSLVGDGKTEKALQRLTDMEGPEWVKVIADYHGGLIAAMGGDNETAQKKLQSVVDNRAIISVLTETYIRAVEVLARNFSQAGNKEKAREMLDYGLSLLPSHSPFVAMDDLLKADKTLKPIITSPQQGVAELFYSIASAIRRDGAGGVAKSYYQIASFLSPQSDVIKIGLGETYLQQGDYEKSSSYYELVSEKSPFYRLSRLEQANNFSRVGKIEEAITNFRELIAEEPEDITGYVALGGLFSREERYREAADVYDAAVDQLGELKRPDWNLFFRRGIAYERLKEWEKAEPNFKQALELSKDQPEVLNYLGYSWVDQGINLDEGMELIRKAVRLRPRSGFIVDSLGWAHYKLGEYEDAVRELEKAVALMPQDPTINDHLGDAYWRVGRKLEATFQWNIALAAKDGPDDPVLIRKKLREGLSEATKSEAKANE